MPLTYKPCNIKPFKPLEENHETIRIEPHKSYRINYTNHNK